MLLKPSFSSQCVEAVEESKAISSLRNYLCFFVAHEFNYPKGQRYDVEVSIQEKGG